MWTGSYNGYLISTRINEEINISIKYVVINNQKRNAKHMNLCYVIDIDLSAKEKWGSKVGNFSCIDFLTVCSFQVILSFR